MFFRFGSGGRDVRQRVFQLGNFGMREAGNQRSPLSERPADVGAERGDQVLKQKSDTVAHIRDYRLSRLPVFQQLFCLVESGTGQIQIERATVYPPGSAAAAAATGAIRRTRAFSGNAS